MKGVKRSYDTMREEVGDNILINAIKSKDWDSARKYTYQASCPDEEENYALHYLCSSNTTPMGIVHRVYSECPKAAYCKDSDGNTPLLNAVNSYFIQAIHFLAVQNPDTVLLRNDEIGNTPLQFALDLFQSNIMIDILLFANPKSLLKINNKSHIIFDSFFQERDLSLRAFIEKLSTGLLRISNSTMMNYEIRADETAWILHEVYVKSVLLLRAKTMKHFNRHAVMHDRSWLLIHSACKEDACPWSFCHLYLRLYPREAMVADADGNLPIHIIAASRETSKVKSVGKDEEESLLVCHHCGGPAANNNDEFHYFESDDDDDSRLNAWCICSNCYNTDDSIKRSNNETVMRPGMFCVCVCVT